MILEAAAISNVGNVRQNNEDNYILMRKILPMSHINTKIATKRACTKGRSIFGVFDGMGGYSNGELASFLAAKTALRIFSRSKKCPVRETLAQICKEANLHICEEMQKRSQRIGTTAAMLSIHRSNAVVCNIGDSPIFLFRKKKLRKISCDHTERSTYEAITGKTAPKQKKFKLTQNLGIFPEEIELEPFFFEIPIQRGDRYLICSDGLTDMVETGVIRRIVKTSSSAQEATERLCDEALRAGGKDNITILCAFVAP